MKKPVFVLMIALLPLFGCDHFKVYTVGNGDDSGNSEEQGSSGGGSQSGDSFKYEVAATQPSGAVKGYTKDYVVRRSKGAGNYQWMVIETKVAYDSKGRIAKEEETTTYYKEDDNGNVQQDYVNRSARYRVYDDAAHKIEIRKSSEKPNTAIFKGDLDANGKLVRMEYGYYDGSSWKGGTVKAFEYAANGLLSKLTYPGQSSFYPFEFFWNTSDQRINSIRESDPRASTDPEEDETRNYFYTTDINPTFDSALDIASFAAYSPVIGMDYYLPLGKGSKYLVDYANTTYRNEAEKFTYEWDSGKKRLTHIKLVQKLFPDDAGVMNERQFNYWPEYYD